MRPILQPGKTKEMLEHPERYFDEAQEAKQRDEIRKKLFSASPDEVRREQQRIEQMKRKLSWRKQNDQ